MKRNPEGNQVSLAMKQKHGEQRSDTRKLQPVCKRENTQAKYTKDEDKWNTGATENRRERQEVKSTETPAERLFHP